MADKIHVLDIEITLDEWALKTPEEKIQFANTIYDAMTLEQRMQMERIGKRVIIDDIFQRTQRRPRTALRTMARSVNVTVNEVE